MQLKCVCVYTEALDPCRATSLKTYDLGYKHFALGLRLILK